jgi:hypothetical protein
MDMGKSINTDWKSAAKWIGAGAVALGVGALILKPALIAAPVSMLASFFGAKTSITGIGYLTGGALALGGAYAAYRGFSKLSMPSLG